MNISRSRQAALLISVVIVISALIAERHQLFAQQTRRDQRSESIQGFFQNLAEHYDPNKLPSQEERLRVADQVANAPSEEISTALPWIFAALAHRDDNLKMDAGYILMMVAHRRDGAELLSSHVGEIGALLNSPNPRVQSVGIGVFAYMSPAVPSAAVAPLLAFVRRTNSDPGAQSSAVSLLLKTQRDSRDVAAATEDFLSRPLDKEAKKRVFNGIANSRTNNAQFVQMLIAALDDPDQGIRFTAAQAFWRMPMEAVLQARPVLLRVASRPDESPEVKAAAKKALQQVGRQQ